MGYIYLLENKKNGKRYVGQTTTSIHLRWISHKKDSRKLDTPLYQDIQKFGFNSFNIRCLEECKAQDKLNEQEKYWIIKFDTLFPHGYNLKFGGGRGKHTLVSIEKMRISHKDHNKGKNNPFHGKKHSSEAKFKMKNFWRQNKNFNVKKEFCKHGHPFDKENTYIHPNGGRRCRKCNRIESLVRYHRNK